MKRRRVWQRIVSLLLVFVMVFTVAVIQPDVDAFAAAKTPVATHGRLSVKGADLVDARVESSSSGESAHMASTGMSDILT